MGISSETHLALLLPSGRGSASYGLDAVLRRFFATAFAATFAACAASRIRRRGARRNDSRNRSGADDLLRTRAIRDLHGRRRRTASNARGTSAIGCGAVVNSRCNCKTGAAF